jgi:hypothetical protein
VEEKGSKGLLGLRGNYLYPASTSGENRVRVEPANLVKFTSGICEEYVGQVLRALLRATRRACPFQLYCMTR